MTDADAAGPRPGRLVVVTGTGTEVGKTWVSARVLAELRTAGVTVAARKPAQSFDPADRTTDAHELAKGSGEDHTEVCPKHRWYEVPMAPPMAAAVLGRPPVLMADLVAEIVWPVPAADVGLVESAGGLRSPIAEDGDTLTLIEALQPDLVVVIAESGLGTINSIRLTLEAIDRGSHVAEPVVHLNRYDGEDDLHRRNRAWLDENLGVPVVATLPDLTRVLRG